MIPVLQFSELGLVDSALTILIINYKILPKSPVSCAYHHYCCCSFVCYPSKQNDSRLFDALETIGQDREPDNVLFDF